MSNTEASRAWEYLRRNPAYIEARRMTAEPAPEEPAPFPLRAQTAADREAAAWGLLAWEDPDDETGAGVAVLGRCADAGCGAVACRRPRSRSC